MESQKNILFVLFGIFVSAMITAHAQLPLNSIEAVCGRPINAVVETDPTKHRYMPYMIKVPRCRGTYKGFKPSLKRCAPSSSVNVSYEAFEIFTGRQKVISITKHLACASECVQSQASCNKFQDWKTGSCLCKCKYQGQPPQNVCPYPKVWQMDKCNCGCPMPPTKCPARKEWDEDICGCSCKKVHLSRCLSKNKMVNQENCKCMKIENKTAAARGSSDQCKDVVQNRIVVMIVVIEFLGLLFIFFLVYRCCLRHISDDLGADTLSLSRRMKYEINTMHGTLRKITKRRNKRQNVQPADKEFHENGVPAATIKEETDNESHGNSNYERDEPKYLTSSSDHEEPVGFYPDAYDTYGSDTATHPADWYGEVIGEERSPLKDSVSMESGQVTQV